MFTQQLPHTLKTLGETVRDGGAGREGRGKGFVMNYRIKAETGGELGLEVGAKSVRD